MLSDDARGRGPDNLFVRVAKRWEQARGKLDGLTDFRRLRRTDKRVVRATQANNRSCLSVAVQLYPQPAFPHVLTLRMSRTIGAEALPGQGRPWPVR